MTTELSGTGLTNGSANGAAAPMERDRADDCLLATPPPDTHSDNTPSRRSTTTPDPTQQQIVERLAVLADKVDMLIARPACQCQGTRAKPAPKADHTASPGGEISDWDRRKAELLKDYQDDGQTAASPTAGKPLDGHQPPTPASTTEQEDEADTADRGEPRLAEPEEIIQLRNTLEEKLRQSEIEISIERAKLARIKQELDDAKAEMDRDFARKHDDLKTARKKNRMRWKRFLSPNQD